MINDVLIMGGGATGQLAASYLQLRFPQLRIVVVEGPHKTRPIVGESFVEVTIDFLLELGLGAHLIEKHFPKYGLTYYYKVDIEQPADRTYVVDELRLCRLFYRFRSTGLHLIAKCGGGTWKTAWK